MTTKRIQITEQPLHAETAKAWLKVEHDDEDALIQALIEAAVDMAEQQTGRAVAKGSFRMLLPGFPAAAIKLTWPPVVSVSSIYYTNPEGGLVELPEQDYAPDVNSEPARVYPGVSPWPATAHGANVVEVVFEAGYGADCPAAIKHWVLAQVAHWYRNREAASEKALEASPYLDRLLDRYRIWSFG